MKNSGKISGMLLMLFIAGSLSLNAQRGMRGMRPDSAGMNRMRMEQRQMHMMMQNPDSLQMRGMRHGMAPMHMNNMGQFMCPMCGMGRQAAGYGRRAPGMRVMENIPNLTDKQKTEIADLRQNQHDEMQKFRSEMQGKMKDMRETHKAKVMSLLTDEQKKWFEENTPKPLNK
jgi:hypothetical protein